MHKYLATVRWSRDGELFHDSKYSRVHDWEFEGGVAVRASSSPLVVPLPYSAHDAVNPEEALVASASSCHMLWFLSIAAKRKFTIDEYLDQAEGYMGADHSGKIAFTEIVLRPKIKFIGEEPTDEMLEEMHHLAHENCFIANSLRCEIRVE